MLIKNSFSVSTPFLWARILTIIKVSYRLIFDELIGKNAWKFSYSQICL